MNTSITPLDLDEEKRLNALRGYQILDSAPEQEYDDIARLIASICDTPIALVSLVDDCRQWFKAVLGLEVKQMPRDIAFCAHAIQHSEMMIVKDATKDARFHDNPLVTGPPCIRFYTGMPLKTPEGHILGTLCVIDYKARNLNPEQIFALQTLARQVVNQLELKRHIHLLDQNLKEIRQAKEELLEAKKEAERANKMKGQFLAVMSHEIRTPLYGIMGTADLLKETSLNAEQSHYLASLKSSGAMLSHLLDGVLDISKLEAGKVVLENTPFNVALTMQEVVDLFLAQARIKKLQIKLTIGENVPALIKGDMVRLKQVLCNLVNNAVKFTHEGQVNLRVERINNSKAPTLKLSIIDTGTGIAAEAQKQIFESFNQAEVGTHRAYGGTGLGTSIAKELVGLMGGEIGVVSPYKENDGIKGGAGSNFWFTIPVQEVKEHEILPQVAPHLKLSVEEAGEISILVAEDNSIGQLIMKNFLTKFGFQVDVVENGQIAVEMANKKEYGLIFMDTNMPVMNGLDAAKLIRRDRGISFPIISLTANVYEVDKQKSMEVGMNDILSKPFDKTQLIQVLNKYL